MLTDSRPAGGSPYAKPQAAATIPPPTVNASRTTGRAGSIITTPEAGPVYKMGGTSRIAIREPRGAPANQLRGRRLSPLPPRRSSVTSCEPCRSTPVPPLDPRSDPMRSALSLPVVVVVALAAAPLAAQETPTEKTAAADVIRRMNELERSLALPRLAAAVAVAEFLTSSKTPGTVTVYGTPAEELASPAAKTVLYNAGVFKGADVLIRSHSSTATQGPGPGFGSCCMNINVMHYTFSGAPAHQLQAWDGRDALMGVIELFNHIDGLRKTLRPEAKIQGIITEGGKAPNVVPDRAVAEFWIRYPDPVYLAQVTERVNDAARGAGLATGTKVRIDVDSSSRNGISVATLNDVAFAYLRMLGATKVEEAPGRPLPYEETGTVATQIPGVGVTVHSSNGGYHTFDMEADALGEVGHHGFLLDAQAMAAVLYHFATDAPYRAAVKREFDGLKGLYSDYLAALRNAYPLPSVPEPTGN